MRITAVDEELYTNNNSGTNFGVTMGSKLFSVLTESLYKDKPRAVCRETIANCVDAHRMRDELFVDLTPEDQQWKDLVAKGFSEPGTPYRIHLPTDIEPWLEFEDYGVGLPVEKILGEVQFVIDPENPESAPAMVRDGNGHPVRSGGVYTTLFGSDKEDNDNAIGAYGLGCKSPFAIVDTFLVKSRVNGEEHQYLMFLNSKREPQVDWLTKDPVTGEPSPLKTEKKNGLTVRMDAIPVSMKTKITVSVADILQTFPKEEQPIVNEGMFTYKPVEYEEFVCGLRIVKNFHYGHVFNNDFVVNTGGVVYPVDRSKLEEVLSYAEVKSLRLYASEKCIVMEMPLGTVNIPPSREEISYDEITMNNIVDVLRPALDHIQKLKTDILDKLELNLSSLWKARAELSKLEPDTFSQLIREKWESLVEEKKKIGRESGVAIGYHDNGFKAYAQIKEDMSWVMPTRDFRIYVDNYYGLNAANMDDYVLDGHYKRKICSESHMLIDITSMSDRKAIVVLNDTQFGRGTVLTRLKKLRDEDLNVIFEGLVDNEQPLPEVVVMVGASNKDVEIKFDDYVKFTEYLCRVGNFNYILGSEVCEAYEKMPRKLKQVTVSEIQRNLAYLAFRSTSSEAYEEYAPNNVFEIEEEDKDFTYILRDEMPELRGLRCDSRLEEYARSRGVLGEKTFVVNGVRTESRKMCESLPYFRRVDLEALKKLDYECKMVRLEYVVTQNSPLKDPVAEYGLKTILGALLFSEFLCGKTSFGSIRQFLVWLQVFVNRHPLTSFEENDEAFRHYGKFTLGDLYNRILTFHKILGTRGRIPRCKIPQNKMQYEGLEELRTRYGRFRSSLEDCLEPTIWAFSALNIAPWKEDMELLAQLEAVFRERQFKAFHNEVFPTVLLKPGMIRSTCMLKDDLDKLTSKFATQLSKTIGEHQVLLERIPEHWAESEMARFHAKLDASLCVCRLGKWDDQVLKSIRSFFPQFKTSAEIEEENRKEAEE